MGHDDVKTTMKYLDPDTSKVAMMVNHRNHPNRFTSHNAAS